MYDGKVVFKVDLDTKDFTPQIEKTKQDLDDLLSEYDDVNNKLVKQIYYNEDKVKKNGRATTEEKRQLTELQAKIQETTNKYIDLKAKQDAIYKADYKKGLSSIKNINMLDNAAYNKSYTLQYEQIGNTMTKLSGELPYVADGFKDIGKEAEDAGDGMEDAGKKGQKSGNDMSKGFSKGLKSAKKLALGIIGIRSAYMLARKAASSYMAQDEDLAKSMQSVWTGLGAFLAPLLETLTNLMLKFVGYLNVFIKALTGKDLIAAANAKILEKQAKAQEKLNKATKEYQNYDFDVIRTQQTNQDTSIGSSIDESQLIKIPELNQKIVKKLQDLAKWLKENKDLIEDIGVALGITFGAIAIGNILKNIATLIGSTVAMTGLLGLLAVLGLIATIWTITLIIDGINEVREAYDKLHEMHEKGWLKSEEQYNELIQTPPEERDETWQKKSNIIQSSKIDSYIETYENALKNAQKSHFSLFGIFNKETKEAYKDDLDDLIQKVNQIIGYAKEGELTEGGYRNLLTFSKRYGNNLDELNEQSEKVDVNQKELNKTIRDYASIYPEVFAEMLEFNNLSDEQQQELANTITKLTSGKLSIKDYAKEWKKIPPIVKTEAEAKTKTAEDKLVELKNKILSLPKKTETKTEINDKEANTKLANYKTDINSLNKTVTTTLKINATEIENLKNRLSNTPYFGSAFSKMFDVLLSLKGFAGGGYISQPTLAMVGEGKYNEYVIPEGEDYISRLANEIGKYGNGSSTTNIYLDGRLIQRQVSKTADRVSFTKNGR